MSNVDERQIYDILFKVVGEDNIKRFEAIYGPLTSNNIANLQAGLERRLQATKD